MNRYSQVLGSGRARRLIALGAAAVALALPAEALADSPDVAADAVVNRTASLTTVLGSVNPGGESTSYQVLYDTAASTWCQNDGLSGTPAHSTTAQPLGADNAYHEVSVDVGGLTPGADYCAAIAATNASDTSTSLPAPFNAGQPQARPESVRVTGRTTAVADATVNPAGQSSTYRFSYDTAGSPWCSSGSGTPAHSTAAHALSPVNGSEQSVGGSLTGLTPGQDYCVTLEVTNATASLNETFEEEFRAGAPQAYLDSVTNTGATTASVNGNVEPRGQSTEYQALYDESGSAWCDSGGQSGTPAHSTAAQPLSGSDDEGQNVHVGLTGLSIGTSYCVGIKATNASGSDTSSTEDFTAGAPSANSFGVSNDSPTSSTLSGTVRSAGQSTTYRVFYDTADSDWCDIDSGTPAHSTPEQTITAGAGTADVHIPLSGLTAGTSYCAELRATNASASSTDGRDNFTAGAPDVAYASVGVTGSTTATVGGSVNPIGQATTYRARYDNADSPWCSDGSGPPAHATTPQTLAQSDTQSHEVSVDLTGLTAGTSYCAELEATNASGASAQGTRYFTPGQAGADTGSVTVTGASTATLDGTVTTPGADIAYQAVYDTVSSTWCSTAGQSGSPGHATSAQTLASDDTEDHEVTVDITGLVAGTHYCVALRAGSGPAAVTGDPVELIAGQPRADTWDVTVTGATTASLDGSVNPSGQSTTYKAVYDAIGSDWCSSDGQLGTPAHSTAALNLADTDADWHEVTVPVTGLTGGTHYCIAVRATNASASSADSPIDFTAGHPRASLDGVTLTGATTATVDGSVNPSGQTTTYQAAYDTAGSPWCSSDGESGTPAHTTAATTLGASDTDYHSVSVDLSGLTGGTQYCAGIQATNGSGTAVSGLETFRPGAPGVSTYDLEKTSASTATVSGSVKPGGLTTTYRALYDTADSEWCNSDGQTGTPGHATTPQTLSETDLSYHDVTVDLHGLSGGTTYCVTLQATNTAASVTDEYFPRFTAGEPDAFVDSVTNTGATSSTVSGSVNPVGQTTTYQALYDTADSPWCMDGGESGTPAHSTAPQTLGASDTTDHDVSVVLNGLTAGTDYCVALKATNPSGSLTDYPTDFTAGAPRVDLVDVMSTGATSGRANGSVSPAGQATEYYAEYDDGDSDWCYGDDSAGPAHSTTPQALAATDGTSHTVSVDLGGLTGGHEYCVRLVATNAAGSTRSRSRSFEPGVPTVEPRNVTGITDTGATLAGSINPSGVGTSYHFEWDTDSSSFCTEDGSATHTSPTHSLPADLDDHPVSESLTGLSGSTGYCYLLVVTNGVGDTSRFDSFSTQPPGSTTTHTSDFVDEQGSIASAPEGSDPSPQQPVIATITTPVAGTVAIDEQTNTGSPPSGYTFLGYQIAVTAPAAQDAHDPLRLEFRIDHSLLPVGTTAANLVVFRDGNPIAACTTAGTAAPDPCVEQRQNLAGGDVLIRVLSLHASNWNFGTAAKVADHTAPVISSVPADMTLEATGPDGSKGTYSLPKANDNVDGPTAVTCAPASGATFPLGTTKVNCSATDKAGNKRTASFNVQVRDTTAPELSKVPADVTTLATSASGATVRYKPPKANDLVDGSVGVSCNKASGAKFPVGTTKVTCSASDAAGNASKDSFKVTVTRTFKLPALRSSAKLKVKGGKVVLALRPALGDGSGIATLKLGSKKAATTKVKLVAGKGAKLTFKLKKSLAKSLRGKTKNASVRIDAKGRNGKKAHRTYKLKLVG